MQEQAIRDPLEWLSQWTEDGTLTREEARFAWAHFLVLPQAARDHVSESRWHLIRWVLADQWVRASQESTAQQRQP